MTNTCLDRCRLLLLAMIILLLALLPVQIFGVSGPQETQHQHTAPPAVGLEEHLGSRVPLDIILSDEEGQPVRLADLVTGPTIILPVYYGCTNVCNYLQGGLSRVLPTLKSRPGIDYRVISISFDTTETWQQAARAKQMYLTSMNVPFPKGGWRFLTGKEPAVRRLTDAAGYHYQRKGRDFIHPVASLILSGDGTIIRYLYGTSFLSKDLSLALWEAREGKVGRSIAKVVDFCFTFDPEGKTYVFNLLRVSATVVMTCAGGFLAFLLFTGRKRPK